MSVDFAAHDFDPCSGLCGRQSFNDLHKVVTITAGDQHDTGESTTVDYHSQLRSPNLDQRLGRALDDKCGNESGAEV